MAPANSLFQRTTKAKPFDISTSMFFLTEPKYHVRIVNGLKNNFPNTMFFGVLLWTLIEVLLCSKRSLYALAEFQVLHLGMSLRSCLLSHEP